MKIAAYRVHKLLQELNHQDNAKVFLETPDVLFDRYGLDDTERQALIEGTPPAMSAIGIHPLLQMMLLFVRSPAMAEGGAMAGVLSNLRDH